MGCEEIRRQISDGDGRALRARRLRAHLRDCAGCSAFAAVIPSRRANLHALVPPLPAAASCALLARAIGTASSHGAGASATATGSVASGALGKMVGTTIASKAVTGATVAAVAAAGAVGVTAVLVHVTSSPPAHVGHVLPRDSSERSGQGAGPAPVSRGLTSLSGRSGTATVGRSVSTGHVAANSANAQGATHAGARGAWHHGQSASAGAVGPFASPGAGRRNPSTGGQPRSGPGAGGAGHDGQGPRASPRGAGVPRGGALGVHGPRHVGQNSS